MNLVRKQRISVITVISGKEGHGISLVRTESSVITKEQFVLIFIVYACTCFQNYYAF